MKGILILLLFFPALLKAQENKLLRLNDVYDLALKNYPLLKQKDILKQTADFNLDILEKGFMPMFSISGQASYQSDVTSVKIPIPGFTVIQPSKDQYKLLADVSQLLYDGGNIQEQKKLQRINEDAEQQKLEVELYKIKERVNQLFLGVLYLDEQLKLTALVKQDLETGFAKTEAQVNNGIAFRSNLNVLKAELIRNEQRVIELLATRKGYTDVIGLFIHSRLPADVKLEKPDVGKTILTGSIQRPELKWYSAQSKLIAGQRNLADARNRPKASLFVQGGYGRPGLNFLTNDFTPFYTAGLRFSWAFGGLYTIKKEKQLLDLNKRSVEIQQETFLLNTSSSLLMQQSELEKLQLLIAKDEDIIALRIKVKDAAKAQLDNGVITSNDYLREMNAEDQARQSLITHQVQLLQAQINYQTISGNQ